jgi:PAS domain S-box-containing protein
VSVRKPSLPPRLTPVALRAILADINAGPRAHSAIKRYTVAIAVPCVALLATQALEIVLDRSETLLFLVGVAVSAWYGGLLPGMVTTVLSVAFIEYVVVTSPGTLLPHGPGDLFLLALFGVSATLVTRLSATLQRSQLRASQSARQAVDLASQLEEKADELERRIGQTQALSREVERQSAQVRAGALEVEAARDDAERERARLESVLDGLPDAAIAFDLEWRYMYLNPRAAELVRRRGKDPERIVGATLWEVFPDAQGGVFEKVARRALKERRAIEYVDYSQQLRMWVESTIVPIQNGVLSYERDITERKRTEESQRLLAEAGRVLASSLDRDTTIRGVARVVLPALGSLCIIDLLEPSGALRRAHVQHIDPEVHARVSDALRRFVPDMSSSGAESHPIVRTVRSGDSTVIARMDDDVLDRIAINPEHRALLASLDAKTMLCVPLTARGRVIGVISFFQAQTGRGYDALALDTAEEVARRAAIALDNAQLFASEQAASRAKTEFLATMSHELRTPLNAIAGYTELLEIGLRGPVTGEQREDLQRIRRSQRYLLGLINDVLNFAKIDSGHLRYDIRAVRLDELLVGVEALIAPQLRSKQLRYHYEPVDPEVLVRVDGEKLEQIILNLLSNAVKFTEPHGEIRLSSDVRATDVLIEVKDTGRGVPADRLDAIFEPFVQIDRGLTRTSEGTGLGLAISRDLARAMGGDLSAWSDGVHGSVFTLRIPREQRTENRD